MPDDTHMPCSGPPRAVALRSIHIHPHPNSGPLCARRGVPPLVPRSGCSTSPPPTGCRLWPTSRPPPGTSLAPSPCRPRAPCMPSGISSPGRWRPSRSPCWRLRWRWCDCGGAGDAVCRSTCSFLHTLHTLRVWKNSLDHKNHSNITLFLMIPELSRFCGGLYED